MAPRSIWKGAISFGLVSIPVKVYGATEQKDIAFNQVHTKDNGRIRYKKVCEACGEEVEASEISKSYTAPDGRQAILEKEDFENLPLATSKAVEVVQFVDEETIAPTYFEKAFFLEADGPGAKPYVLLRDALKKTGKAAVVKVALRQRESLALIRAQDDLLMLHTMLWPDEIRDGEFAAPSDDITASDAEIGMAEMFIDQMSSEFTPDAFSDQYREALDELVNAKLSGEAIAEATGEKPKKAEVVDLVAALRASLEAAKAKRGEAPAAEEKPVEEKPKKRAAKKAS